MSNFFLSFFRLGLGEAEFLVSLKIFLRDRFLTFFISPSLLLANKGLLLRSLWLHWCTLTAVDLFGKSGEKVTLLSGEELPLPEVSCGGGRSVDVSSTAVTTPSLWVENGGAEIWARRGCRGCSVSVTKLEATETLSISSVAEDRWTCGTVMAMLERDLKKLAFNFLRFAPLKMHFCFSLPVVKQIEFASIVDKFLGAFR